MNKNIKEQGLVKSPYSKSLGVIKFEELSAIISMKDSGRDLYMFLLQNQDKFLAHNGIAYINPIELVFFLDVTRKTIYNGINSMISSNILKRCNVVGEYYYNFKYFPE